MRTLASRFKVKMTENGGIRLECCVIRRSQVIGEMSRIGLMCSYVGLDEISNKVFEGKV